MSFNSRVTAFLTAILAIIPFVVIGATWTVDQDSGGDFLTVAEAVAVAVAGDVIEISPGIYPEHLHVTVGLDIRGVGVGSTVLDGEGTGRILWLNGAADCRISGLTFVNGTEYSGGAIHLDEGATAEVENCTFENNHADHDGGAIWSRHAGTRLVVRNSRFIGNRSDWCSGGAGAGQGATTEYYECVFADNVGGTLCGGVSTVTDSPMTVERCLFTGNSAAAAGAVLVQSSPATVRNNTFFENRSTAGDGATVAFASGYNGVFSHNIVTEDLDGHGVRLSSAPSTSCNIFFGNRQGAVYDGVLGAGDIVVEPGFCDYSGGDFGLCATSPALPDNNTCGLIGAFGMGCGGCGPVPTVQKSLGSVKALFR